MSIIATDQSLAPQLGLMLEGYECPAILVSPHYQILATNSHYQNRYGTLDLEHYQRCFQVSHGYTSPCDESGESCPLKAAQSSGHKERVLHIHQTPRGKEYVDVEMVPIFDSQKQLLYFVELLRPVNTAGAADTTQLMVGTSKAFSEMLGKITRVSSADASVLLLGESGTGKELAASAIHQGSARSQKSLVTLECAGLTDSLFESELFGHVKGAFTGAHTTKVGLIEEAHEGTLFLDEIGDVPLSMQVKLLRVLESGTYRAVGSASVKTANFRLICATHKNIGEMVRAGLFREDLYYRINVFPIRIPTLAERKDDLPLLIHSLLRKISPDKTYHFTDSAMRHLCRYNFPGNIRELRNILNRALVYTDTNIIEVEAIKQSLDNGDLATNLNAKANLEPWVDLRTAEHQYLEKLITAFDGDKQKIAETAGISLRSLYRKMEEMNNQSSS